MTATGRSEPYERRYVVAGHHAWSREAFDIVVASMPGVWTFISEPRDLAPGLLERIDPRYIFFLHWSHKVPAEILSRYECVCFHMTDVPYGRGGSPLQNLILAGHTSTVLTALRMVESFDAGPVYYKVPLSLEGTAAEIYRRTMRLASSLIPRFIAEEPAPVQQSGTPTVFRRRKPEDSALPPDSSTRAVYDFIRMLDAEGYPRAFVRHGVLRLEFSDASIAPDGAVEARVRIQTSEGAR